MAGLDEIIEHDLAFDSAREHVLQTGRNPDLSSGFSLTGLTLHYDSKSSTPNNETPNPRRDADNHLRIYSGLGSHEEPLNIRGYINAPSGNVFDESHIDFTGTINCYNVLWQGTGTVRNADVKNQAGYDTPGDVTFIDSDLGSAGQRADGAVHLEGSSALDVGRGAERVTINNSVAYSVGWGTGSFEDPDNPSKITVVDSVVQDVGLAHYGTGSEEITVQNSDIKRIWPADNITVMNSQIEELATYAKDKDIHVYNSHVKYLCDRTSNVIVDAYNSVTESALADATNSVIRTEEGETTVNPLPDYMKSDDPDSITTEESSPITPRSKQKREEEILNQLKELHSYATYQEAASRIDTDLDEATVANYMSQLKQRNVDLPNYNPLQ